jgi:hypothetical protein
MAWKWFDITSYIASVGGSDYYYGIVQLSGNRFYGSLHFHKIGPLSSATTSITSYEERFFGHMDYQQMQMCIDLLRNEKPIKFGWDNTNPNNFQLMTGSEPVGEGDGILAENAP